MEIKSSTRVFGGTLLRLSHASTSTQTTMTLAIFLPTPSAASELTPNTFPTLFYLSGLTCTDENVCQKGTAVFAACVEHGLALVCPDTSPRGHAPLEGESASWDFGIGAGFYLDATKTPFDKNYNMYSYVTKELPAFLATCMPALDLSRLGITGHSMGGHGALTCALKNPTLFKSVSAFAPICNPSACPWGNKAFTGYLSGPEEWAQYDATALIASSSSTAPAFDDILIDVGTADSFYIQQQLLPENLQQAAAAAGQTLTIRMQEGYDHSYYFISSFIAEHVAFHKARLA